MRSPPAVLDITSTEGELKTPSDCERDQLQAYTSTTSTCSTVIRERTSSPPAKDSSSVTAKSHAQLPSIARQKSIHWASLTVKVSISDQMWSNRITLQAPLALRAPVP